MTITHHPSDTTLAAFAAGTLDEAQAVVVATHLAQCGRCRAAMQSFEGVGGALLDAVDPAEMTAGAVDRVMTKLGEVEEAAPVRHDRSDAGIMPAALSQYAMGPWRWLGRGVAWRTVDVPSHEAVRVFLLKA